jgi:hypothetical protein
MSDKLDKVLSAIALNGASLNGNGVHHEEAKEDSLPDLNEIFPKFMEAVSDVQKEQVLKNLKLWLMNADRFAKDPIRTRVNENNHNYKNLFGKNPLTE